MYAKHYPDTFAGLVFSQTVTPLGASLPLYTDTAIGTTNVCALPLWNPPDSNVLVEVMRLSVDRASGTAGYGVIGVMAVQLREIATGSVLTNLGDTAPLNANLLAGRGPRTRSSNSIAATNTTLTTGGAAGAPTPTVPGWIRTLYALNLEADTGTAHATSTSIFDFDGTLCVPPGWLIYFAGSRATAALFASSLVWKEWPINR